MCPIHGEFTQSIFLHKNGSECKKCALIKRSAKIIKHNSEPTRNGKKVCIDCGEIKSVDLFPLRNKADKSSHRNQCTDCFKNKKILIDKNYRQANKKEIRAKDLIYRKKRMATDTLYKATIIARSVTRKSISKMGYTKMSHTYEILGCSYEDFKTHIESLFLEGMNWDNRSKWHIDHIIPISFAKTEEECLKLSNYKNLRPIWGKDNLEKSDTIREKTDIYTEIITKR